MKSQSALLFENAIIVDLTVPNSPRNPIAPWAGNFDSFVGKYVQSGVTWASFTVATDTPASVEATIMSIAASRAYFLEHTETFILIESAAGIERAKRERKLAVSLNFQGTNAFGGRLEMVELYRRLGVLHALLCYNEKNAVADGCYERTDAGLSRYGLRVVQEMNRVGMLVDVTHTGRRSSLDAIEASSKPVIMSHSNAHELANHPRNVTNAQIKAIARTGGVIGIAGINAMTTGTDDAESISPQALFRHIDFIAQLVGGEHVGFGLDYVVETDLLLKLVKQMPETYPADQHWNRMWSAGPEIIRPTVDLMSAAGYKDDVILGILGGNWMRVFREAGIWWEGDIEATRGKQQHEHRK